MKYNILTLILTLSFTLTEAQIIIGKNNIESPNIILDFDYDGGNNKRGIILPAVTELPDTPANGTFVFDTTDNTVKVFYLNNLNVAEWVDLTGHEGSGSFDTDTRNHLVATEETGDGTIIGADDGAEGVLVLESSNKSMILPKVASPHINVKSPYPGMMCYDTVTKSLAVFDGTKWYFWR